jgi:type IV pilus assembly protein PilY1
MWAFDISSTNSSQWKVAYKSGSTPHPLFTAAANQPITVAPVIVRNPAIPTTSGTQPNLLVMFGTGQYLINSDRSSTSGQSFYGVWDAGTGQLTPASLVQQTIGTGTTTGGVPGRTLTNNSVNYAGSDYGWYMDLPTPRERVITDAVVRGSLVYFNTTIPDNGVCSNGGTGWLMVAKVINGGHPDKVAFDLNGDGHLTTLDTITSVAAAGVMVTGLPSSPVALGNKRYLTTTETVDGSTIWVDEIEDIDTSSEGRYSWEELIP